MFQALEVLCHVYTRRAGWANGHTVGQAYCRRRQYWWNTSALTSLEQRFAQTSQENQYSLHVAPIYDLEPAGWWYHAVPSTVHLCARVLTAIGCGSPRVMYHGCAQTLATDRPLYVSPCSPSKTCRYIYKYIYTSSKYIDIYPAQESRSINIKCLTHPTLKPTLASHKVSQIVG